MMKALFRALAPLLLAILVTGCSRVTIDNYDRLEVGMRYDEVKQILGPPNKCSDVLVMRTCTWGDDRRYVSVGFVSDQVVIVTAENLR